MTGVFKCCQCSTYFSDSIPPLWLSYWPSHCETEALLMRVLDVHQETPEERLVRHMGLVD